MVNFIDVTIDDKTLIENKLREFNNNLSDLTFTNLFIWKDKYNFKYSIVENFLWVQNTSGSKEYYSLPIGSYTENDPLLSIDQMINFLRNNNKPLVMKKVPVSVRTWLEDQISKNIQSSYSRDDSDYIYSFAALKNLNGPDYHKKNNRVNKFKKVYNNRYRLEVLSDVHFEECIQLSEKWCHLRECSIGSPLWHELKAIKKMFRYYHQLNLKGHVLIIDEKVQGFTVSEIINNDMLLIHFEKANTAFKCIYNYLSYAHLNGLDDNLSYVNREQDLGIKGLRKSKMSYHPIQLNHKYTIVFD